MLCDRETAGKGLPFLLLSLLLVGWEAFGESLQLAECEFPHL